jgi:hypothetical protein
VPSSGPPAAPWPWPRPPFCSPAAPAAGTATTTAATTTTTDRHPPAGRPRYDGLAGWYDAEIGGLALTPVAVGALSRLLGPGSGSGIRPRVGVNHLPLADLVGVFLNAGLTLRRLEKPGDDDYPVLLALALER